MFRITLLSVVTLMHVYVFWRAASVPYISRRASKKLVICCGLFLWFIFFLASTVGHGGAGRLSWLLEICGMNLMAIEFLVFTSLLTIDIFTGFGFLFRKIVPSLRGIALIAGLILSVAAMIQGARAPAVKNYTVKIPSLPDSLKGTTIAVMSDLHIGAIIGRNWFQARVEQVKKLNPDIIALVGDVFEGHGAPDNGLLPVLKNLTAPLGVYAVPGNHESHGNLNENMSIFARAGIHVLLNRWDQIRPGLIIAGVEYDHSSQKSGKGSAAINKILESRPPGATILLSHAPRQAEAAAAAGVDLMLCGHTHGGQIWPFGYLVRYIYPLLAGQYDVDGMKVIVCRGTGTWGPRMRLWHRGEISYVTLVNR